MGIAKYLSRTGKEIKRSQLIAKLGIDDQDVLQIGFEELEKYGYAVNAIAVSSDDRDSIIRISSIPSTYDGFTTANPFIQAANELAFQQQFFDGQLLRNALHSSAG